MSAAASYQPQTVAIMQRITFSRIVSSYLNVSRFHTARRGGLRHHAPHRNFSNSQSLGKGKRGGNTKQGSSSGSEFKTSQESIASEDPLDLSQLENGIASAISRLKDELSKLRVGGRLNPEAIEGLRVQLSKDGKETAKLGELAQVVPKGGRMVTVLVSEES
ncbi:hypothetical protein BJX61DRAFT_547502, partial [Aspergillus egyptiacus]